MPSVFATISATPLVWEVSIEQGSTATQNFQFKNSVNSSRSIALTKTGTNKAYLNLSNNTLAFTSNTTKTITAILGIPSNANEGSSVIKINFEDSEITIVLNIQNNDVVSVGKCRLDSFPDSFTLPVVSNAPPITQLFSILVVKHCDEEVIIKQPLIIGNTQTANGLRPLNIVGGTDLGIKEPNEEGTFTVQIDSSNLPTGTYEPYVTISGNYKGETISTKIPFKIIVSQGANPLEGANTLPNYIFSATDLLLNSSYTITAQNDNPNYEHFIEPNEYIYGERVDIANGWIFYFKPTKIGTTTIRVYTYFKGAPIGGITSREIRVSASNPAQLGSRMRFDFFPPQGKTMDALEQGDIVNFLVKSINNDNDTGTVIANVDAYLNGVKLTTNSFIVNAGQDYVLTASSPGFQSVEKKVSIALRGVMIAISPNNLEMGKPVYISTVPADATILVDGVLTERNFTASKLGTMQITASASGFATTNMIITITPQLEFKTDLPSRLSKGNEFTLNVNKNVNWQVLYRVDNSTNNVLFAEGNLDFINFIPDKAGVYDLYINNELIKSYKLTSFSWSWLWWAVGIAVIAIIIRGMSAKGGIKKKSSSSSQFELDLPGGGEQ